MVTGYVIGAAAREVHVASLGRVLDRRPSRDPRSRAFPFRAPGKLPRARTWTPGPVLDQGNVGMCTGAGWAGALTALKGLGRPAKVRAGRIEFARALYTLNTTLDTIAGSYPNTDTGSTVLAGAKACGMLGLVGSYTWCHTAVDVRAAILTTGPVVLGVDWFQSMFTPDRHGYLVVDPSSGLAGGHCLFAFATHTDGTITLRNSWGDTWGDEGNVLITPADLDVLLDRQGEACVPVVAVY